MEEILDRIYRDNKDFHGVMWQLIKEQNVQIAQLTQQLNQMQQMMAQVMGIQPNQSSIETADEKTSAMLR